MTNELNREAVARIIDPYLDEPFDAYCAPTDEARAWKEKAVAEVYAKADAILSLRPATDEVREKFIEAIIMADCFAGSVQDAEDIAIGLLSLLPVPGDGNENKDLAQPGLEPTASAGCRVANHEDPSERQGPECS